MVRSCLDCGGSTCKPKRRRCPSCQEERDRLLARGYQAKRADKNRARMREYSKNNRERLAAYQREYRRKNPQLFAGYEAKRREEHSAYALEFARRRRAERPDDVLESNRKYRAAHPEREALIKHRRRERMRLGAQGGGVTGDEWLAILESFDGKCAYCMAPADTMDHVEPLARGGLHIPENLVPACRSCNSSKNDSSLLLWLMRGGPPAWRRSRKEAA